MVAIDASDPFYLYLRTTSRSERTAGNYLDDLKIFQRWCYQRETRPEEASKLAVQTFLAAELARVSLSTVAHRKAALCAYFAYLGRQDVMEGIQVKQIKLAPRKPLSDAEFNLLLEACRNERDRAMLIVTVECGLRVSELTGLRVPDVDLDAGLILVRGKGDKERWLGLSERAVAALRPFVTVSPHVIWWTRDGRPMNAKRAKRNMEEIEKRAQVKAHYHRLRTTFAHRFLHATHDLDSLQTLMGHSDANTTRRYAAFGAQARALEQMRRFSSQLL